jgi:small subunit ribosomal protein S6
MNIRRVYETTIIINASLNEQDLEAATNKVIAYITDRGGVLEETNKWGNRRLAYPINKKHHGYYLHLVYNIQPVEIPSIERFLVLEDTVIRHLTLQLEPELREFRKQKSLAEGKSGETMISSVVEIEKVTNVYGETEAYLLTGDGVAEILQDAPAIVEDIIVDEDIIAEE